MRNASGVADLRVINSVMPKGVEHYTRVSPFSLSYRVINSVMPKGVEHFAVSVAVTVFVG